MSTYSDAWHALSPKTLSFYHNFQRVRMNQTWHEHYDWGVGRWYSFSDGPWIFHSYFAYAIAYRNWTMQLFDTGSFNPEIVQWAINEEFSPPHPTPQSGIFGYGDYHHEAIDIPLHAFEYPREKHNVRRSYWTGKPRHRRNL